MAGAPRRKVLFKRASRESGLLVGWPVKPVMGRLDQAVKRKGPIAEGEEGHPGFLFLPIKEGFRMPAR